ncbi:uncharacterized protein LOC122197269 isoform X1 [Lactuca sativa]|uniref:uncharacterized protein LOC122197269 isoform X1 n=1 Tax=Lactuca sativa TaxID=4236 RepID=UPI001C690D81|nr:uncharacterized protein LOC122197269 isoform X1 [Lactuca sativa]
MSNTTHTQHHLHHNRSILLPSSQPLLTQPPENASVLSSSSSFTTDLDLRSKIYTKERKKNEEKGRFLYSCTIHCSVYIGFCIILCCLAFYIYWCIYEMMLTGFPHLAFHMKMKHNNCKVLVIIWICGVILLWVSMVMKSSPDYIVF